MSSLVDIFGTSYPSFQLGKGGVQVRSQSGNLEVRHPTNTVLAPIKASALLINENQIFFDWSCRARHTLSQAVATGTATVLSFGTARHDTAGLQSSATQFSIPAPGTWDVGACIAFETNTSGSFRQLSIRVNGTTTIALLRIPPISTAVSPSLTISTTWRFAVSDYIEVLAQQNSGVSLNVLALNAYSPEFWATFNP